MTRRFEPEDLRRELRYLRKGAGFTADRLARSPAVRNVLGTRGDETGAPFELLLERFESAIWSLKDDDASVLADAYALTPETRVIEKLEDRRDYYGAKVQIRRAAVADRDTAAIERLLAQLITGWYPKSPMGLRIPETHNGTVQHAVHVTTVVRDRKLFETRHHYRFFVLFGGAQYFAITSAAAEQPAPIGDFTVKTVEIPGGYRHEFWHATPMRRGQTYDLAFRIPGDPDDKYWLTEESLGFHEPTRFAVFETVFLGAKPSVIWKFSGFTALERPGNPITANQLALGQSSSVQAEFRDMYGGLYCGIAWEW